MQVSELNKNKTCQLKVNKRRIRTKSGRKLHKLKREKKIGEKISKAASERGGDRGSQSGQGLQKAECLKGERFHSDNSSSVYLY